MPLKRVGAISNSRRRIATATSSARPARAAITNTPSPPAVTARCASGPNSRRSDGIRPSSATAPGQRQRIEPQHRLRIVIAAPPGVQQTADAAMHRRQGIALQSLRQRHLQQITPGIGGKPGAQIGIDPVCQMRPGAASHQPTFLGRNDFAGDLRLQLAAGDQQVIRGCVRQSRELNSEPARGLQRRGPQHVEHRHQRAIAGQRHPQPFAQPPLAAAEQAPPTAPTASPASRAACNSAVEAGRVSVPRSRSIASSSACRAVPPARRAARTPLAAPMSAIRAFHAAGRSMRRTLRVPVGHTEGVGAASLGGVHRDRRTQPHVHSPPICQPPICRPLSARGETSASIDGNTAPSVVIPAKAGNPAWVPACAGMTARKADGA